MTSTEPTVLQLADELQDAYRLIAIAAPLALQVLKTGAASLDDQRTFWEAVRLVEEHIDLFYELDAEDPLYRDASSGIYERMEWLMALRLEENEG